MLLAGAHARHLEIHADGAEIRGGEAAAALLSAPYLAAFYQPPSGFQPYPYFPRRVRSRSASFVWQAGFQWAGGGGWAVPVYWMARGSYHLGWDLEARRQRFSDGTDRWLGGARLYATYPAGDRLLLDFGLGGRLIHRDGFTEGTRLGPEIALGLLAFPGRPISLRLLASAGEVHAGRFESIQAAAGLHLGRLEISPGYSFFSHSGSGGRLAGPELSFRVWF